MSCSGTMPPTYFYGVYVSTRMARTPRDLQHLHTGVISSARRPTTLCRPCPLLRLPGGDDHSQDVRVCKPMSTAVLVRTCVCTQTSSITRLRADFSFSPEQKRIFFYAEVPPRLQLHTLYTAVHARTHPFTLPYRPIICQMR